MGSVGVGIGEGVRGGFFIISLFPLDRGGGYDIIHSLKILKGTRLMQTSMFTSFCAILGIGAGVIFAANEAMGDVM